ncbi:MAG: peptidoglycan-binding protein [Candidatus Hydrogenedentes bacterium]|nr:peptidoglycan-binding protein [Candidatus Hydrogenedentota bacterium]
MYLSYYGFNKEPFHITPDPDFFFMSPSHKEALAAVVYGVEKGLGFVAMTGEVGTGKTTILRAYLERIRRTRIRPIFMFNPNLTFEALLMHLLHELGIDGRGKSERWMLHYLMRSLVHEVGKDKRVVLIIDEAQHMPNQTLEKLRLISNLETMDYKLMQIVLVGQPELDVKLGDYSMRQIRQRIAVRAKLRALTPKEGVEYVRHRIAHAGGNPEAVFAPQAIKAIVKASEGYPRSINILCDNALVSGLGYQCKPIAAKVAREVIREFKGGHAWPNLRWAGAACAGAAIASACFAAPMLWNPARTEAASNAVEFVHAAALAPSELTPAVAAEVVSAAPPTPGNGASPAASTPEFGPEVQTTDGVYADLLVHELAPASSGEVKQ